MTATIANPLSNTTINGTEVLLDTKCPFLTPRDGPAQSVQDLRPDDIRIVAGLGDRYDIFSKFYTKIASINTFFYSVMAGFAAKGVQGTFFNVANLYENRGISFAMGGVSCGNFKYIYYLCFKTCK
jgi:phospholipase B1